MKELLSLASNSEVSISDDRDPRVIEIDDEDANTAFSVLSSETARQILKLIYEDARTPSEVASAVDTSLQNTNYHLTKLRESGFIEIVGTRYSEQGREMDIYAPATGPLLIYAGADTSKKSLLTALKRLVGVIGLLGLVGALVNWFTSTSGNSGLVADSSTGHVVIGDGPAVLLYQLKALLLTPGGIFFSAGLLLLLVYSFIWVRQWYQPKITIS